MNSYLIWSYQQLGFIGAHAIIYPYPRFSMDTDQKILWFYNNKNLKGVTNQSFSLHNKGNKAGYRSVVSLFVRSLSENNCDEGWFIWKLSYKHYIIQIIHMNLRILGTLEHISFICNKKKFIQYYPKSRVSFNFLFFPKWGLPVG